MISFIFGPDRLLAREAAVTIAREVDPDGLNTSWLDGRETSLDRIIADIGTVSFFAAPRVVIVSDLFARASGDGQSADAVASHEGRPARGSFDLERLLAAVPEEHCLILFEPGSTTVPAVIKSAVRPVRFIASEPPRGPALIAWVVAAAERASTTIDRRAAQLLVATLYPQTWDRKPNNPRFDRAPDMALLTQEVEKLALAAYPDPITTAHVHALAPGGPDQRVFRFLDASLGGDLRAALAELERLEAAAEEPAMVLAQVLGQIELAAIAAEAGARDATTVARDLGTITPGRMSAVMTSRRRNSATATAVMDGVEVDRKLKLGRIRRPGDALHELLLALATAPDAESGRSP